MKIYLRKKAVTIKNNIMENRVFSHTLRTILPILEEGDPKKALTYLQKKYWLFIYPSVRFLKHLYQYANAIEKFDLKFYNIKKAEKKILIHFCCWGTRYANKVKNFLLPSLLAKNNLPSIAKIHNIMLLIHCDKLTKATIMESLSYRELVTYVTVKFCLLPVSLMKLYSTCAKPQSHFEIFPPIRYLLLGVCQTHAFKVALNNHAYISLLMPDFVLSESFMTLALEKAMEKNVVLTTTYRTNHHGVFPHLKKYYISNDVEQHLTISANALVELQIKNIHPNEQKRIVSTTTKNFTPMARLIFKDKNGFIFRCFHYHPVVINCEKIYHPIKLDYLPIDNTALNCILDSNIPYQDQAWVCDDACQMALMELSDENPETDVIINSKTLSYQELITQVRNLILREPKLYDSPFNRFLISHRHRLIAENVEQIFDEAIDDTLFFNEIYKTQ